MIKYSFSAFLICVFVCTFVAAKDELPGGRDRSELMNIICHDGDKLRGIVIEIEKQKLFFIDYVNDNTGFKYKTALFKLSESNWTISSTIHNRFHHAWALDEKNVLTLADKNGPTVSLAYERVEGENWKIRCAGKYVKVSDETEKFQFDDDPKHTINVHRLVLTDKEPSIFTIRGGSK